MSLRVLITQAIESGAQAQIAQHCELWLHSPHSKKELIQALSEVDAAILMLTNVLDSDDIKELKASRLKIIANHAVGFDNIDIHAAAQAGIWVSNTPDVLTEATAEMAWALLLALARRVREGEYLLRSGTWQGWEPTQLLGQSIVGKKLGILGAGRIGQAMAAMGQGFQMQVYYSSRSPKVDFEERGAKRLEIEELCRTVDILSMHLPGGSDTQHLINARRLAMCQPHCLLVNTGRGTSIDESALLRALEKKQIAGAALDVYEFEPRVTQGLLKLDNVVLTHHLGSATISTRRAMAMRCWENIQAVFKHLPPPDAVNSI